MPFTLDGFAPIASAICVGVCPGLSVNSLAICSCRGNPEARAGSQAGIATREDKSADPPIKPGELLWKSEAEHGLFQMVRELGPRNMFDQFLNRRLVDLSEELRANVGDGVALLDALVEGEGC